MPEWATPLFGKWDLAQVQCADPGLRRYINLKPVVVVHTSARHANRQFGKSNYNIVERLINGMMRTEVYTGKKGKAYKVVMDAFELINRRTKQNPVQIYVDALINSSPREEVTRLRFGGINVPRAVDSAPSRRLDYALRNICKGALKSSHKSKKPAAQCLAQELIAAAKGDMESFAVGKKEELERVAKSAR